MKYWKKPKIGGIGKREIARMAQEAQKEGVNPALSGFFGLLTSLMKLPEHHDGDDETDRRDQVSDFFLRKTL